MTDKSTGLYGLISTGAPTAPVPNERCREEVREAGSRWPRYHQCARPATKDGYCGQHHPDARKARQAAASDRYRARMAVLQFPALKAQRIERAARAFLEAYDKPACLPTDAVEALRAAVNLTLSQLQNEDTNR